MPSTFSSKELMRYNRVLEVYSPDFLQGYVTGLMLLFYMIFLHLRPSTHPNQSAWSGWEIGTAALLTRRRMNQSRQSSLQKFTFNSPDSHERIRHRRPPHIQPFNIEAWNESFSCWARCGLRFRGEKWSLLVADEIACHNQFLNLDFYEISFFATVAGSLLLLGGAEALLLVS
ncbi:hypothetical protein HAX54_005409 [Datura stramonium]|uniref:Uncharacterized protein n=1 Tax=Datura stramonium TaxID=4076 RepID=A0ABS8T9X3_DATST|nr:hypothetical protein [Datura stramonium]